MPNVVNFPFMGWEPNTERVRNVPFRHAQSSGLQVQSRLALALSSRYRPRPRTTTGPVGCLGPAVLMAGRNVHLRSSESTIWSRSFACPNKTATKRRRRRRKDSRTTNNTRRVCVSCLGESSHTRRAASHPPNQKKRLSLLSL